MRRLFPLLLVCSIACKKEEAPSDDSQRFVILHTNDWQSHMLGFGPNAEYTPDTTDDDLTVGGLARIKTMVDNIRASSEDPVVLYDAGDWMSGALFQILATSHAAELHTMGEMGYDAATIGNHEFDWGPGTLGTIISQADTFGVDVPLLSANIVPSTESSEDDPLEAHFTSGRIQPTMIQELDNGLKLGLFGVMGDEAQGITPGVAPATFTPAVEAATEAVASLKDQGADIIIGITHSGVSDDLALSEDHIMARSVEGIDIIVGGHSHTPIPEPLEESGTIILQAGAYTRFLGELHVVWDGTTASVESYELHEVDDSVKGDETITTMVDGFINDLNAGPLVDLGYGFDEPIMEVSQDMKSGGCGETGLGNMITDAYRTQMNAHGANPPIAFAFESQGLIRDPVSAGAGGVQGFSDLFRILSVGEGDDGLPGYGLVSFYSTGKEIRDVCEVSASISPSYGCDYFIEVSGLRCHLDMSKGSFNKATGVDRWDEETQAWVELDTHKDNPTLHRVAVDAYVAQVMGILEGLTFGAMVVTPKDADGVEITEVSDMLFDLDPSTPEVEELKLWKALIEYTESFEDTDGDGVPEVPARYLGPEDRYLGWE
jgi:5'-nucleotidase / UDP-sugar diphosphatase